MARLPVPVLQAGNLQSLMAELHDLHAKAGWPSTRDVARHLDISHTTVYELLTRSITSAPKLTVLLDVVEQLALLARRVDVEATLDKFDRLWRAAHERPFSEQPAVPAAAQLQLINVKFVHPDRQTTATATVDLDLSTMVIIERLVESGFIPSEVRRSAFRLHDPGSGRLLEYDESLRTAGIAENAVLFVTYAVTAG